MNMQEQKGKEGMDMEKGMVDDQIRDEARKVEDADIAQDMEQVKRADVLGDGADHSNMANSNSDILMGK